MDLFGSIHVPEHQRTHISWCDRVLSSASKLFDTPLLQRLSLCPYPLESDQTVTLSTNRTQLK